jgi:hypothetical protein
MISTLVSSQVSWPPAAFALPGGHGASSKQETQARNRTLSDASFRCAFSSASSEIRGKTNEITIWIA